MATSVDNTKTGEGGAVPYATAADVDDGTSDQLSVTPLALSESDLILNKEDVTNKDASGGYVGKTLEKINFWNAAKTFLSFFTNANTAARTYTFPDRDGTIADNTDLALKEDVANKSTDTALGTSDTAYPSQRAVKTYVDNSVAGLLNDRGNHDASGNSFPTTGGSGSSGAVKKGDTWYVSVAGTLGGVAVNVGDTFRAKTDAPGQTASNWAVLEGNIGYVPERSIDAASSKTTPVDADYLGVIDSAAGNALKKISWADIKTTLKTYFDTLYAAAGSGGTTFLTSKMSAGQAFNTTSFADVTNLSAFTLDANSTYVIEFQGKWQSDNGTNGIHLTWSLPAGATYVAEQTVFHANGTNGSFTKNAVTSTASEAQSNAVAAGTEYPIYHRALVVTTGTAGNAQLRCKSSGGSPNSVSLRAGSAARAMKF